MMYDNPEFIASIRRQALEFAIAHAGDGHWNTKTVLEKAAQFENYLLHGLHPVQNHNKK